MAKIVYDGKEKKIYSTDDPNVVRIHHTDMMTAFGGIKRGLIKDKGMCCNLISAMAFMTLTDSGIPNHFISLEGDREMLCQKIEIIPLKIIVRNRLAGTTAKMLGLEEGYRMNNTVYELRYNCDDLCDPIINEHHAVALGLVTYDDMQEIYDMAARTNIALFEFFHKAGIELVDFKMEVGRASDGRIIVSDEISPDNCRLWDEETGFVLDKDRFRHDLSDVSASYKEVLDRLIKASEE